MRENASDWILYSDDWQNYTEWREWNYTYIAITVPIITFCLLFVAVNLVVLGALFWVRRPISPTLHISISLAVSDLVTLALDGLTLTLNSLLPVGFAVDAELLPPCRQLLMEAVRLGCRFTTLGHLLALAGNHYLGIKKPLHYPSLMTYRNITFLVLLLWMLPSMSFIIYFHLLEDDGFAAEGCPHKFMMTSRFRTVISSLFFGSISIMSAVYLHIYMLVRRHQKKRSRFRRAGSAYRKAQQSAEEKEAKNEKALYTTLLIVGSTVLGWLPASLAFFLVCEDCVFQRIEQDFWRIAIFSVSNVLLILKTALNTYIYAARMSEIRVAMKRMRMSLKQRCCKTERTDMNGLSDSRLFQSRGASTRRSQRTVNCRLHSSLQRRQSNHSTQL